MSILHTTTTSRGEDERRGFRVPVVLPRIEVTVTGDGGLDILLDQQPYPTDRPLHRQDLTKFLDDIAASLGTPVRVEVHEADKTTYTDVITPPTAALDDREAPDAEQPPERKAGGSHLGGGGFTPGEDVAVAVVVAHQVADTNGTATLRLPPALREAHPGCVVLAGEASGNLVLSGRSG